MTKTIDEAIERCIWEAMIGEKHRDFSNSLNKAWAEEWNNSNACKWKSLAHVLKIIKHLGLDEALEDPGKLAEKLWEMEEASWVDLEEKMH